MVEKMPKKILTQKRMVKYNMPKETIPIIYFQLIIFFLILIAIILGTKKEEVKVNLDYNVEILDRLKCQYNETIGNSTKIYYVTFVDYSDLESFQRLSGTKALRCDEVKEYPILI